MSTNVTLDQLRKLDKSYRITLNLANSIWTCWKIPDRVEKYLFYPKWPDVTRSGNGKILPDVTRSGWGSTRPDPTRGLTRPDATSNIYYLSVQNPKLVVDFPLPNQPIDWVWISRRDKSVWPYYIDKRVPSWPGCPRVLECRFAGFSRLFLVKFQVFSDPSFYIFYAI